MMERRILGIIGQTGAGKSTLAAAFAAAGATVIDGDQIAREVMRPGSPCLLELQQAFGQDIVDEAGALRRSVLAERAFASPEQTQTLNRISHRYICDVCRTQMEQQRSGVTVIDAAALLESGMGNWCDSIVYVTASEPVRLRRIMARDGLTEQQAKTRMAAQKPDAFYRARATRVLCSDEEAAYAAAVHALVEQVMKGGAV